MTEMHALLTWGLAMTADRLGRAVSDLTPEEATERPQGLAPIVWQVGHVALTDSLALARSGEPVALPTDYDRLFTMGSGSDVTYPPLNEILTLMAANNERLCHLAAAATLERPIPDVKAYRSVGEALAFLVYHRGYHIGKIATLRGLLGLSRPFG